MSTQKKQDILKEALSLFAAQGYHATSTSKVAKAAGVSEGLIFRHFGNKEGLLSAIMQVGYSRLASMFEKVNDLPTPGEKLKAILTTPFSVKEEDYPFWRLMYSLKWQADSYDDSLSQPMKSILIACFKDLGYTSPAEEAEAAMAIIDGVSTAILLRGSADKAALERSILAKYRLN